MIPLHSLRQYRPLDVRTRTTTSTKFDLRFFASSQNIDFQSFILPFFTRKVSNVTPLSLVKEVTRSPDAKTSNI